MLVLPRAGMVGAVSGISDDHVTRRIRILLGENPDMMRIDDGMLAVLSDETKRLLLQDMEYVLGPPESQPAVAVLTPWITGAPFDETEFEE